MRNTESSVVALDVETGRPRWSFQTVHHDVWDYDVPAQPVLADLPQPAIIVSTKQGQVFVLDRRDGTPFCRHGKTGAPGRDGRRFLKSDAAMVGALAVAQGRYGKRHVGHHAL